MTARAKKPRDAASTSYVRAANVLGALACCREAAKRRAAHGGGGAIVNVSSGAAYIGGNIAYSVSKGAMNSLQVWAHNAGCC